MAEHGPIQVPVTPLLDPNLEKFTDGDLRRVPALFQLALGYLDQYRGDYEFLRDARHVLQRTGTLDLSVARGVLNCMRRDVNQLPRIRQLLTDQPVTPTEVRQVRHVDQVRQPREQVTRLPVPPARVYVQLAYNWTWLWSKATTAFLVHRVNSAESVGWWSRHDNAMIFRPIVWCQGKNHYGITLYTLRNLLLSDQQPDWLTSCVRCDHAWSVARARDQNNS